MSEKKKLLLESPPKLGDLVKNPTLEAIINSGCEGQAARSIIRANLNIIVPDEVQGAQAVREYIISNRDKFKKEETTTISNDSQERRQFVTLNIHVEEDVTWSVTGSVSGGIVYDGETSFDPLDFEECNSVGEIRRQLMEYVSCNLSDWEDRRWVDDDLDEVPGLEIVDPNYLDTTDESEYEEAAEAIANWLIENTEWEPEFDD